MLISRDSWHYRLVSFFDFDDGIESLCVYVRRVFYSIGLSVFLVACVAFYLFGLTSPLWGWGEFLDGLIGGFVPAYLVTAVGVMTIAKEYARNKKGFWFMPIRFNSEESPKPRHQKIKEESEFSRLLSGYWKAIHEKICPLVEFE